MDAVTGLEKLKHADIDGEEERFVPRTWHRLALLALIYVTVRFLDAQPGPARLFDFVIAAAAGYTLLIRLLAMRFMLRAWCVLAADLAFVLVMCLLTGGIYSLVKYFGLAYFYLLSPYMSPPAMKAFLLGFSSAVTLIVVPEFRVLGVSGEGVRLAVLNLFVLNGAGWPSILLSGYIHKIRKLQKDTSLTFHSLNSALHLRTQNLQAALDALTHTHSHLKEVDENKTKFLTNVSHELRTPLSSVRSFSEILMSYDDIDRNSQKEFLGIINDEANRLTLLINDVLNVVRLDSGRVELHMVSVDMAEVIRGAVKMLMPMAAEKGISLSFQEPDGWAPCIKGDRNQMTQVMVNIINNAIKFTSKGGITVSVSRRGADLETSVADTGEGVFPEELEDIFNEFYRVADNVQGRPRGSGLGLPISKKILELHGGRIWVKSEIGRGSDFRFTVPLDIGELIPPATAASEKPATGRRGREKPCILIVEENPAVRQALRKELESVGCSTLGAESGQGALKLATEWEPDCIISCMQNFREDDANFYSGLRAHPRTAQLPVILTSLVSHPVHGLQVVVNAFIQRPVDRYELKKAVDMCLPRSRGHVLVISPNRLESRTVQLILGNEGYSVAISGVSSWRDSCMREDPALIILDGCAPDGTVLDLVGLLRDETKTMRIPLVLVTEAPVSDNKVSAAVLGRTAFDTDGQMLAPLMAALENVVGAVDSAAT